jgi:hypothetical protein
MRYASIAGEFWYAVQILIQNRFLIYKYKIESRSRVVTTDASYSRGPGS